LHYFLLDVQEILLYGSGQNGTGAPNTGTKGSEKMESLYDVLNFEKKFQLTAFYRQTDTMKLVFVSENLTRDTEWRFTLRLDETSV
jgi:hypothetical protein